MNIALQLIYNISYATALASGLSIAFYLIVFTTKNFHFAHGAIIMLGPYLTLYFYRISGVLPFHGALLLAAILAALAAVILDKAIYQTIQRKGGGFLVLLIASLGIYVFMQNMLAMIFGDDTLTMRVGDIKRSGEILGVYYTDAQVNLIIAAIAIVFFMAWLLERTRLGRQMQAVASNATLSEYIGLSREKIIGMAYFFGSGIGALAATLWAMDVEISPTMGLTALMTGIVVVIIAGQGGIRGILAASLLVATSQAIGDWVFGTQWKEVITFAILLVFLLAAPKGMMKHDR